MAALKSIYNGSTGVYNGVHSIVFCFFGGGAFKPSIGKRIACSSSSLTSTLHQQLHKRRFEKVAASSVLKWDFNAVGLSEMMTILQTLVKAGCMN